MVAKYTANDEKSEHPAECECRVCEAWKKSGLKVFRLTLDFEALNHQEFDDFYYIATADRTEEEFRQAVGEVAQAIHESNFTDRECWACLRNAMNDRGFVPIWDYETGVVTGSLKLPEPRGLDLTLDEEVKA